MTAGLAVSSYDKGVGKLKLYQINHKKHSLEETSMCTFDSPVSRCEAVSEMVLTDETQAECACEHGCPPDMDCPLKAYFNGLVGSEFSPQTPGSRQVLRVSAIV